MNDRSDVEVYSLDDRSWDDSAGSLDPEFDVYEAIANA